MYYILLKGFSGGLTWQFQYLMCCLVQLAVDLLLFETIECAWLNFTVPQYVQQEVAEAAEQLVALAKAVAVSSEPLTHEKNASIHEQGQFFLNAPAHLFVSLKVAKAFPQLIESMIVGTYTNHLPGAIRKTWPHAEGGREKPHQKYKEEGIALFAVLMIAGIVTAFMALPFAYQKVSLRLLQPLLFSGVSVAFYAVTISTVGVVLFSLSVAAVVCLGIWRLYQADRIGRGIRPIVGSSQIFPMSDEVPIFLDFDEQIQDNDDVLCTELLNEKPLGSLDLLSEKRDFEMYTDSSKVLSPHSENDKAMGKNKKIFNPKNDYQWMESSSSSHHSVSDSESASSRGNSRGSGNDNDNDATWSEINSGSRVRTAHIRLSSAGMHSLSYLRSPVPSPQRERQSQQHQHLHRQMGSEDEDCEEEDSNIKTALDSDYSISDMSDADEKDDCNVSINIKTHYEIKGFQKEGSEISDYSISDFDSDAEELRCESTKGITMERVVQVRNKGDKSESSSISGSGDSLQQKVSSSELTGASSDSALFSIDSKDSNENGGPNSFY
jgi:hypothetical protein